MKRDAVLSELSRIVMIHQAVLSSRSALVESLSDRYDISRLGSVRQVRNRNWAGWLRLKYGCNWLYSLRCERPSVMRIL